MKTSFKKAIKIFSQNVLGISHLTHTKYLSGRFLSRGFGTGFLSGVVQGGYVLIPPYSPFTNCHDD